MGEVEQRELRLTERINKMAINLNWSTKLIGEAEVPCPKCGGAMRHYCRPIAVDEYYCIACDETFDPMYAKGFADARKCAAELPLERTGDTPKACFVSHKSIWDDDDNSYLFCPYCGERLSS